MRGHQCVASGGRRWCGGSFPSEVTTWPRAARLPSQTEAFRVPAHVPRSLRPALPSPADTVHLHPTPHRPEAVTLSAATSQPHASLPVLRHGFSWFARKGGRQCIFLILSAKHAEAVPVLRYMKPRERPRTVQRAGGTRVWALPPAQGTRCS